MGRPAEGSTPSPAHAASPDVIVDWDEVPIGGRDRDDSADLFGQLGCRSFVGIDIDDPLTATGCDPGVPPRPLAWPSAFDEALGETKRELLGAVVTAVEHDNDFVRKAEAAKTIGELMFFVMGHDQRGKQRFTHAAAS